MLNLKKCLYIFSLCVVSFNLMAQPEKELPEYVKNLSKFIQIPSLQHQEKEAGTYFKTLCEEKGLITQLLPTIDTAFNLASSIYPLSSGKPNIILLNHLDVVSPGDTNMWTYPPYSGLIKDDYIWGRGAIDNKGMAIAQLYAVAAFMEETKGENLPFNVTILSVSDEENGGHRGAIPVAEKYIPLLNPLIMLGEGGSGVRGLIQSDPDRVIFGTSTDEKSKIVLRLDLELEASGHGSIPPDQYATKEMVIALEKLLTRKQEIIYTKVPVHSLKLIGRAEKGLRGFVLSNFTFFAFRPLVKKEIKKDPMVASFFTNTIAITNLSAFKTDHNQISNKITATLDCRLIPETDTKQFLRQVKRRLSDRRIKITVEHEERTGNRTIIPEQYIALCQALKSVYPNALNLEIIFPATTDNHVFRNRGVSVYGLFPAVFTEEELKSIHANDEKIHIDRLTNGIQVYKSFFYNMIDVQKGKTKEVTKKD